MIKKQPSKIGTFKVGLMTTSGQLALDDNSTLDDDKIDSAIFSSAFLSVFERLNFVVFSFAGEAIRNIYDGKSDSEEKIVREHFKKKYNNKNSLKKEDIIDVCVELEYLKEVHKVEYYRLKKIRDDISHNLMDLLFKDKTFDKEELKALLRLFKELLISIHNELLLETYNIYLEEGLEISPDLPFKTISQEFMVTDIVLSTIIDRKKHQDIFKILEEE